MDLTQSGLVKPARSEEETKRNIKGIIRLTPASSSKLDQI